MPPIVSIVGRKRSGKTEIITGLIRTLSAKGYRVAAVRHSPHEHSADTPGSDTERFRLAGACASALVTAREADFFVPAFEWKDKVAWCAKLFSDCHLVLMEGGMQNAPEKIEVVPPGKSPLCAADDTLRAVVGVPGPDVRVPAFALEQVEPLSGFVETRYLSPVLSAAVLAGGRSKRLGRDKALVEVPGGTAVEWVLKAVRPFVSSVRIVTNRPEDYRWLGLESGPDIRPGCGPLSGIHAALSRSPTEYVLVLSCDIPLIRPEFLRPLVEAYPGHDIAIYKHAYFEPLCAIYRRTCLGALEELIDHEEYRILDLFPSLSVKVLRTEGGDHFRSINTDEDYEHISKKMSQ